MKLEEIIDVQNTIYAHLPKAGDCRPPETLQEHTILCEKFYQRLMEKKGLNKPICFFLREFFEFKEEEKDNQEYQEIVQFVFAMIKGMIILHDAGKINPVFQREVMNNYSMKLPDIPQLKGSSHSFFSAVIYLDYFYYLIAQSMFKRQEQKKLKSLAYFMAFVISRHHSDLSSWEQFGQEFLEGGEAFHLIEYLREISFPLYRGPFYFTVDNIEIVSGLEKKINGLSRTLQIYCNSLVRLLYSVLTSADYYATSEYMNQWEVTYFGDMEEKKSFLKAYEDNLLIKKIRKYEKTNDEKKRIEEIKEMDSLRSEMFLEAERNWRKNQEEDIFFLEAPTGSGKSNTAINISLQMLNHGQSRVIYVYPFNTLVEQTLETLENIFNDKNILSKITVLNSVTPIKVEKERYEKRSKERKGQEAEEIEKKEIYGQALLERQFLNYPFIITTHVSLFETLFSEKREAVFGFLQLVGSVIVLDEIQSYKNKIWSEIIIFLKAMARLLGMKVVIMSATLPDLSYLTDEGDEIVRLINEQDKYFRHPLFSERVQISYELLEKKIELETLKEHIKENTTDRDGVLVEFIKKNTAYQFYSWISEGILSDRKIFLLTGDDNIIERKRILREIKENRKGTILVATQVVEAGVDIDMDIGYKDISKLDSEEQFLGRINRSCKRNGKVYFFDLDKAEEIYKGDIRRDVELTLKKEEMRSVLSEKRFAEYYRLVLEHLKMYVNRQLNEEGLDEFFNHVVAKGDFKKIGQRMKLIEEDNWSMSLFLSRQIVLEDGTELDGWECWNEYKELLANQKIDYEKKQIVLSEVRKNLSYFTYEIKKNSNLVYSERIGELYAIKDGEKYFKKGKLDKEKLQSEGALFIEL